MFIQELFYFFYCYVLVLLVILYLILLYYCYCYCCLYNFIWVRWFFNFLWVHYCIVARDDGINIIYYVYGCLLDSGTDVYCNVYRCLLEICVCSFIRWRCLLSLWTQTRDLWFYFKLLSISLCFFNILNDLSFSQLLC